MLVLRDHVTQGGQLGPEFARIYLHYAEGDAIKTVNITAKDKATGVSRVIGTREVPAEQLSKTETKLLVQAAVAYIQEKYKSVDPFRVILDKASGQISLDGRSDVREVPRKALDRDAAIKAQAALNQRAHPKWDSEKCRAKAVEMIDEE